MKATIPDQAILDFLESKGVQAETPQSLAGKGEHLMDGAIWKQWALIHQDWSIFWEENKEYYLRLESEKKRIASDARNEEIELQNAKRNLRMPGPGSYMRRWGIGLIVFGAFEAFLIGGLRALVGASPSVASSSLPADFWGIIFCIISGGIWLTFKGTQNWKKLERCSNGALQLLEDDGMVDARKLGSLIDMPESETRLRLYLAKKRNWIPHDTKIT